MIEEPRSVSDFSQNIKPEDSKVADCSREITHTQSIKSNKSNYADQIKLREMQETMLKLQESVVTLRIENKTLKKEVKEIVRFQSAPNNDTMGSGFKMELLARAESHPIIEESHNDVEIDSELIDDDSIIDYDQKEEIVESIHYQNSEKEDSDSDSESNQDQEEQKVQPLSAREPEIRNENYKHEEKGNNTGRDTHESKQPRGRIWQGSLIIAQNVPGSSTFTKESLPASELDTSGVTDIELIVESHKDLMQYIYLLAKVNEEFTISGV